MTTDNQNLRYPSVAQLYQKLLDTGPPDQWDLFLTQWQSAGAITPDLAQSVRRLISTLSAATDPITPGQAGRAMPLPPVGGKVSALPLSPVTDGVGVSPVVAPTAMSPEDRLAEARADADMALQARGAVAGAVPTGAVPQVSPTGVGGQVYLPSGQVADPSDPMADLYAQYQLAAAGGPEGGQGTAGRGPGQMFTPESFYTPPPPQPSFGQMQTGNGGGGFGEGPPEIGDTQWGQELLNIISGEGLPEVTEREMTLSGETYAPAFQRFLAGLETERGGRASLPVRTALTRRSGDLARLSPMYGVGFPQEAIAGSGLKQPTTFLQFLQNRQGAPLSAKELAFGLGNVEEALRKASIYAAPIEDGTEVTGTGRPEPTPFQQSLASQYEDPVDQRDALIRGLLSRTNPALRHAVSGSLEEVFARQQAMEPDIPFLTFAKRRQYF